jgi:5-methyltetrahydropteroyltriglutamate--homocysteine methyltransferase
VNRLAWISTSPSTGSSKASNSNLNLHDASAPPPTTNADATASPTNCALLGPWHGPGFPPASAPHPWALRHLNHPNRAHSHPTPTLKASLPGPYTLSGRLLPNAQYPDRYALTEALLPIVRDELEALIKAGCREITLDEPSMSCYAHLEDPKRFVDIFNRTVEAAAGRCRLSTHLCFGNFKGHAVGLRRYAPMFPAFLELHVDEIHLEMASREFAEIDLLADITRSKDVAVGVVDVKSYYLERPQDVADRVLACLQYAPPERLAFAPDCGLSQTARWAARHKLKSLVEGVRRVRRKLGLST